MTPRFIKEDPPMPKSRFLSLALACLLAACASEGPNPDASKASTPDLTKEPTTDLPAEPASPDSTATPQPAAEVNSSIESVYSEIDAEHCQVTLEDEPPTSLLACPGPSGYTLEAHDADARVTVSILLPETEGQDRERPLEFWRIITGSFSSLGPRAEWRLQGGRPLAMIVRVNAYEHPEEPDKTTSYLAVAKITADATCVVAKVPPSAEQNVEARQIADTSAGRACL